MIEGEHKDHRAQAVDLVERAVDQAGALHPIALFQVGEHHLAAVADQAADEKHPEDLIPVFAVRERPLPRRVGDRM